MIVFVNIKVEKKIDFMLGNIEEKSIKLINGFLRFFFVYLFLYCKRNVCM